MAKANGRITQIQGGVIDVAFSGGDLPNVYDALEINRENETPVVLEVQKHLGNGVVRCVAMDSTDGLQRGADVTQTGAPIHVPVGNATLGRIFNVLGQTVDGKGPVEADTYYPIHRAAPGFDEQAIGIEIFETGVKAIDLIAPFTKGGKTGICRRWENCCYYGAYSFRGC
jgi:F-type H+-transporting ATPase subunit beta